MEAQQRYPHTPEAISTWVEADRRLDLGVMQRQLSEDVVLISPLTDGFTFTGPEQVGGVFASAFDLLTDIEVAKVTGSGDDWVLYGKNRLDGDNLEEIQWLHLNGDGKIDEITLFIRPMSAAVALFTKIGARMNARGLVPKKSAVGSRGLAPVASMLRQLERRVLPTMGPRETNE